MASIYPQGFWFFLFLFFPSLPFLLPALEELGVAVLSKKADLTWKSTWK